MLLIVCDASYMNYTEVELLSSLINLGSTHKILDSKCLEPSASSFLSRIVQDQQGNFVFLGLMQNQERHFIFPQLIFSHAIALFPERCKNLKDNYLKERKKHKLFNSQNSF